MTNTSVASNASFHDPMPSDYERTDNSGPSVTITNTAGTLKARLLSLGATLTHLFYTCPETNVTRDIVLGFDKNEDYSNNPDNPYFGCIVGRVANRLVYFYRCF
jgi:galactose mutarotase-like enzyme